MSNEKTGGPAYPRPASEQHELDPANNGPYKWSPKSQTGMTLLDHFAGLIYPEVFRQYADQANRKDLWDADWRRHLAADAYAQAAAMIAERNRINEKP
jgi:hypothetical protein